MVCTSHSLQTGQQAKQLPVSFENTSVSVVNCEHAYKPPVFNLLINNSSANESLCVFTPMVWIAAKMTSSCVEAILFLAKRSSLVCTNF